MGTLSTSGARALVRPCHGYGVALVWLALSVCMRASAQPPSPSHAPNVIARAMDGLQWGMGQAEVRKRLKDKVVSADPNQALLRNQAALRPDERVLAGRDPFSRSFYFFRAGRLRKIYVVFEPSAFPEGNFAAFVSTLEKRLGQAKQAQGELSPGVTRRWMEWRQGRTRLRALDETQHLGCYALVYEALGDAATRRADSAHGI
jgi:hypothetical protein